MLNHPTGAVAMANRMLRITLIASVAMGLLACGERTDDELLADAKARVAKRDYASATVDLKTVLQRRPTDGTARLLLGRTLLEQGNAPAAVLELEKAREAGAEAADVAPLLAQAWLDVGKAKELVQTYAGTVLTPPSAQADLLAFIAVAQFRLGRNAEAEATLKQVLEIDANHPEGLTLRAKQAAADRRFDEALALAQRAIRPDRGNGEAHMVRGAILRLTQKEGAAAVKEFEQAAADPRATMAARTALVQTYLIKRQVPEAKSQVEALQKVFPKNPSVAYLAAVVAFLARDYANADAIAVDLLRIAPSNQQVLTLAGATALQRGDLLNAEARLGKVVQTVERAPMARKLLGETYVKLGQPDKALQALAPLTDGASADAEALALAGQAHLMAGRLDLAEDAFAVAAKLKPDDVQVRTALALTDLAKGNVESAIDALQALAAKDPGETADLALITTQMRRQDHAAALAAIDRLQTKQPQKAMPQQLRGQALRGMGDLAAARAAFEAALKLEPQYFPAVANLALLDVQEGRFDIARERLQAAVKANPKNIAAHMALLDVVSKQGDKTHERMELIEGAISANAVEPAPHIAKIALLSANGDTKGAANAAQVALARIPAHPQMLDAAGQALALAGDHQQAISVFNRLASLAPKSALPHLRLMELHQRRGDLAAAKASLHRAFEAAPLAPEVHAQLVAQARRTKDPKSALAQAKEVQRRFPDSALGHLLEGDLEASRKDWAAALAAYRRALDKPGAGSKPQIVVFGALLAGSGQAAADRFAADWLQKHVKDTPFIEHLGGQALLRKDFARAEALYQQVLTVNPRSGAALNNLAWLMAERGAKGAVQYAEKALALAPDAGPVLDTLAKALAVEGDMNRAVQVQRRAIEVMPANVTFRLNLVRLHLKAGDKAKARNELDEVEKLAPKGWGKQELGELHKALVS